MHRFNTLISILACGATLSLSTAEVAPDLRNHIQLPPPQLQEMFLADHPGTGLMLDTTGRISRVHGKAFSHGDDPIDSATSFTSNWSSMFEVDPLDLLPAGSIDDGRHLQPIMYNPDTDTYKFTGVSYTQARGGVPVFRSRLSILVRNEQGHPAVHVASDLRNLSDFKVARGAVPDVDRANSFAREQLGKTAVATEPRLVIWAGVGEILAEPRLATMFEALVGGVRDPSTYRKQLYVLDLENGQLLYDENRILHEITGNISAIATEGSGSDECEEEILQVMPYATVTGGGYSAYADANGDYVLADDGATVTLRSGMEGQWFNVNNQAGSDNLINQEVTPPGPANFVHDIANNDEFYRAEVNAYIESNRVRDYVLSFNPSFPTIATQTNFPVNVNINDSCNAYYDYSSINFYRAGGGCGNTAFSVIVHHEYGHHLVAVGGSGQGAYGEGMGDVMGVLITGDPELARGFYQGNCTNGIRSADNNCQYTESNCSTCGSEIHACGQLISGCVWDIREQMMSHYPDGDDITAALAINSILLHNGTAIDGAIPIDFLTLDDDDDDIGNGTPHYNEIAAGFNAHGLEVPQLDFLFMALPGGAPDSFDPSGGEQIILTIVDGISNYQPGTATIWFSPGNGIYVDYLMDDLGDGTFSFTVPPIPCGNVAGFWFTAETVDGQTVYHPAGAPDDRFWAVAADVYLLPIDDDFEQDLGWTVEGDANSPWERGVPQQSGGNWIPHADYDGSGQCYLTDNQGAGGQHDLDGTTILTSPVLDASGGGTLSWAYWLSERANNSHGPEDSFQLQATTDEGETWVTVRDYTDYLTQGGWRTDEETVEPGGLIEPSATLQIRFFALDDTPDNRIEAAVDAVRLVSIVCDKVPCAEDVNGDAVVNITDLLEVIGAWGPCSDCPQDIDESGNVDVTDLLAVIAAWGPCP